MTQQQPGYPPFRQPGPWVPEQYAPYYFHQPAWIPESGRPYPGGEDVAEQAAADAKEMHLNAMAEHEAARMRAKKRAQEVAEKEENSLRKLETITASEIAPKRVRWLWADRVPIGELTLIVGRGGIGKSTLLCTLAAWISIGDMRGEYDGQPRDVIYVANEDALDYTVVPRLQAAGADLSRVHFPRVRIGGNEDKLILPRDCEAIEQLVQDTGAAALMLDPLSSNLRADANKQSEIRPVMEAIRRMCERAGIAAIGLGHTRKAMSSNLMEAIMGSSELGNVCRSAIGVMRDDDEPGTVVMSQEKANLGRMDIPSYRYKIVDHTYVAGDQVLSPGRIEFLGKTDLRVSDMIAEAPVGRNRDAYEDAVDQIREFFEKQPGQEATRDDVMNFANKMRIGRDTVYKVRRKLKIESKRAGFGQKALWRMP